MSKHKRSAVTPADDKHFQAVRLGRMTIREFTADDLKFFQEWQPTAQDTRKDCDESERVRRAIRAVPTRCWFNARKAILRLDDYADAFYVEGFAASDFWMNMMVHGWIVRGGTIIDPTEPFGIDAYFPGLEFHGRKGIAEFLKTRFGKRCRRLPFFHAFGMDGLNSPSFRKARTSATRYSAKW